MRSRIHIYFNGFYLLRGSVGSVLVTIGGSRHEGNALVARVHRPRHEHVPCLVLVEGAAVRGNVR